MSFNPVSFDISPTISPCSAALSQRKGFSQLGF